VIVYEPATDDPATLAAAVDAHKMGRHTARGEFRNLCPACCDELNAIERDIAGVAAFRSILSGVDRRRT